MGSAVEETIGWITEKCRTSGARADIHPDSLILEENTLNSLDLLQLVFFLEEKFGIKFEVDTLVPENFQTPQSIADLVQRSQAKS